MPDQRGFGNNGTESDRPYQSGQGDDHMNQQDEDSRIRKWYQHLTNHRIQANLAIRQVAFGEAWKRSEQPTKLRILRGESPRSANCL